MYQYVKINGGKIMRKLSTKVRRVLVLTAMFVVMASIPVMAKELSIMIIWIQSLLFTELMVRKDV